MAIKKNPPPSLKIKATNLPLILTLLGILGIVIGLLIQADKVAAVAALMASASFLGMVWVDRHIIQ